MVRVIAFEDLQCPDSAAYRTRLDDKLLPKYGHAVAFEYREFPLAKHDWARLAALAARHFTMVEPDLGIAFRRYCYAHLREITLVNFRQRVRSFSMRNGDEAVAALDDAGLASEVDAEIREGLAKGVSRTPTVFVNDEPFIETFTFEEIARSIIAALAALRSH